MKKIIKMKNELKTLLAYVKRVGMTNGDSLNITMIYDDIEEIENQIYVGESGHKKPLILPKFIIQIIHRFIENKMWYLLDFVDLELDDLWYIDMVFYTNTNRILIRSYNKAEYFEKDELEVEVDDLSDKAQRYLKSFFEYYEAAYVTFDFTNDSNSRTFDTFDYEIDGTLNKVYDDRKMDNIVQEIFDKYYGTYYLRENDSKGDVSIWRKNIFIKYETPYYEYQKTNMDYEIDLNNEK
jgi:hypothetical protein